MTVKYKIEGDVGSVTVAGREHIVKDGILTVEDDIAAHPEFHRLGREFGSRIKVHREDEPKPKSEDDKKPGVQGK